MSMFSDDEVEETNTANGHLGSDNFENIGDGMHSSSLVKESHMEMTEVEPANGNQVLSDKGNDFLEISIEDEQAFDALMQEDFDFDTCSSQETTSHTKNSFVAFEPSNVTPCTSHTGNPTNNDEASLTLCNPPVESYDIDDEFDEISVDDLNRIDREVDLYIERSPDSSSSDELRHLPPVRWDKSTNPVVKPSQIHVSKANWVPVARSSHSGTDLNPVVCRKSYSIVKKVDLSEVKGEHSGESIRQVLPVASCQGVPTLQPAVSAAAVSFGPSVSNSTATTSHLAVKQCPMCYFEFPARYVVKLIAYSQD